MAQAPLLTAIFHGSFGAYRKDGLRLNLYRPVRPHDTAVGYSFVDPATLALASVSAFTAALSLFLSRMDAHHQRITEQPDIRFALWRLSFEMTEWNEVARETDRVIQMWGRGEVDDDRAAHILRLAAYNQVAVSDAVFRLIPYDDFEKSAEAQKQGWQSLGNVLRIYAPDVQDTLMMSIRERRALVDRLIADLPNLRADGPESIQAAATRLHLAHEELDRSAQQLDEFIRDHFPATS